MNLLKNKVSLIANLHQFPPGIFGSINRLIDTEEAHEKDTLIVACSELGTAPDWVSFAGRERLVILQHLAASMPSKTECNAYQGLSSELTDQLFRKYHFRNVIICGHTGCGVIPCWLQPAVEGDSDIGDFRARFEAGTRRLVDENYLPTSNPERIELMIFEHVLCQVENLLTHPAILERAQHRATSFYGWVVDDKSARVYNYHPEESAFLLI